MAKERCLKGISGTTGHKYGLLVKVICAHLRAKRKEFIAMQLK
jgi:hypothetical protein